MEQILVIDQPRTIRIETYERETPAAGEVLLETLYTGISAGTQMTLYRGVNPFKDRSWDPSVRLFGEKRETGGLYPCRGCWGYEEVGRVAACGAGVTEVVPGDVVYGTWSHKSSHVVTASFAADHRLPDGVDPLVGIYSQMGSIALNAVLDADIHVGETVCVFGQGVPGRIVAELAAANGARVIAVDRDDWRLAESAKAGAAVTLNPGTCDVARTVRALTDGRGADVCIEISGFDSALHEAIRTVCYNGRVVCSGFLQGGAPNLRLGEEFHHNRVQIICSQIEGLSPSLGARWNRLRMERTIFALQQAGRIDLRRLITHVIPFAEAARAYDLLDRNTEPCLQVVLAFEAGDRP